MVRPALQCAVLALLITSTHLVHLLAKVLVHQGFGIIALVILFALLKPLSHYLD